MELHQLRYFVAVAESGSFSRAAKQCGIAQPSLSQQIKRLEETLGCLLFDRFGRTIALTEAGEALLPRAKRILAEVRQASDELTGEAPLAQRVRVGAIPTMAPYLLPRAIKRFRRQHPECQLVVREDLTERLVTALVDCELELAVTSTPIDHEHIETQVIGCERLLVAAPRDLPLPPERITIADLREQPTIVLHEMHCLGRQIESFCTARQLTHQIVCRSTQLATALQLVALGLGVSIVPEMCAEGERGSAVRYLPLVRNGPTREIAIAWRRGRTRSKAALVMAAMLASVVQK